MKKMIYMDYAAATPMDDKVRKAMEPYFAEKFYNPSAGYLAARAVRQEVEAARARIARHFGARTSEVICTAGGTEANNLAVHGIMRKHPGANIVISAIEHESILMPAREYEHKIAQADRRGIVDIAQLEALIDSKTVLVSIMYANNEIGTIQSLKEIGSMLEKLRKERQKRRNPLPLLLHTDACQAAGYLDLHAKRLGVDMLTINGGKIYGPKQSAALFVRAGLELAPQILGGGQERGLRSGTENPAAIIGLAEALDLVQHRRRDETQRLQSLQKLFMDLVMRRMPQAEINGSKSHRLPNNVHLTLPGRDNERLMMELDERGVVCAAGSACSASSEEPSHVLKAIGLSDEDARASLRFTMGAQTSEQDVQNAVAVLASCI